MRLFKFILLAFIPTSLFSQEVANDFTKILFKDDFTSTKNDVWTQTYNIDNLFVKQANSFDLVRKNPQLGYFVIPNLNEKYSSYEIKAGFTLIKLNRKNASAGLLLMADKDKSSGILVEVNQKRQYRISRVYPDRIVPISKGKDGWVNNSFAVTKDYNEILVRTSNKVYDLYINQKFITSFSEIELAKGSFGLYIGPTSRASFKFVELLGEDAIKQQPKIDPNTSPEDVALSQIIIQLRNDLAKKDAEIEELRTKLKNCNGSIPSNTPQNYGPDTALINRNRELNAKVRDMSNENDILKAELLKAKAEMARLQKFKDEIQTQQSGDIVINLTNLVTTQKDKITELETKSNQLQEENNLIKNDNTVLSNQIMKRDQRITKLEEKNHELDSINNKYREILMRFNIDPNNPVAPVIENKDNNTNQNIPPSKETIEQDYINQLIEKEREEKKRKEEEERKRNGN